MQSWNDERIFDCDTKFRPSSTFNPKNKDVIIETHLSSLQVKLLDIDIPKDKFNNLSKEERDALHSLKNDNTIVIKGVNKGSGVVVWDREDYLKEAHKQLSDEECLWGGNQWYLYSWKHHFQCSQ